eukprot:EG_transcript_28449
MVQKCAASSFLAVEQFANAIAPKKIRKAKDGTFFLQNFHYVNYANYATCMFASPCQKPEGEGWLGILAPTADFNADGLITCGGKAHCTTHREHLRKQRVCNNEQSGK